MYVTVKMVISVVVVTVPTHFCPLSFSDCQFVKHEDRSDIHELKPEDVICG